MFWNSQVMDVRRLVMKMVPLIISLVIFQGVHVSSESQPPHPQPAGQTLEDQQSPSRSAPTFLGQMLANLINYKLRWLSILAGRLAGNSTGWPASLYSNSSNNMATPNTLHLTPTTQLGIPTMHNTSPATAQHNAHPVVSPGHPAPSTSMSHAFPATHAPTSTQAAHSPNSHPSQPVYNPQTTLGTRAPAQLPSNSHSVQPAHNPASSVSHSPSKPHVPQVAQSPSTHSSPVTPPIGPTPSNSSPAPLSENALEFIPNPDSALPRESTASPEITSSTTIPDESQPIGSSNPLSPSASEPGFSTEPEVSTTSQVPLDPNPDSVPGRTILSTSQPPAKSALDWY